MSKRVLSETFHVALYKTWVTVTAGGDQPYGVLAEAEGVFREDECGCPSVWFKSGDPAPGVVAHECLHTAFWILSFHCHTEPVPSGPPVGMREEYLCYLLEFLVTETTAALARIRHRTRAARKKRQ